jgi:hypothetical protein
MAYKIADVQDRSHGATKPSLRLPSFIPPARVPRIAHFPPKAKPGASCKGKEREPNVFTPEILGTEDVGVAKETGKYCDICRHRRRLNDVCKVFESDVLRPFVEVWKEIHPEVLELLKAMGHDPAYIAPVFGQVDLRREV